MTNLFILQRVNSAVSGGMTIPQSSTGSKFHSDLDMAGRCVPMLDLTQEDEDGSSHMSDIQLQLPASAKVASNNYALVMLSQAEGDLMRNAPSDTVSDGG